MAADDPRNYPKPHETVAFFVRFRGSWSSFQLKEMGAVFETDRLLTDHFI